MNVAGTGMRVVVATRPVDFRKGHDGLAAVVEHELGLDPFNRVGRHYRRDWGEYLGQGFGNSITWVAEKMNLDAIHAELAKSGYHASTMRMKGTPTVRVRNHSIVSLTPAPLRMRP